MLLDNTEKVKQAKKWLHGGKTPRETEEIAVDKKPEPDITEMGDQKTVSKRAEKTI